MIEPDFLRLPAPAKLNLMLKIVGRRSDGYHLLQTVFQFIDHCDWIKLTRREDGRICLKNPLPGVPEECDLTVRAAHALRLAAGLTDGVTIEIDKNLPMGGGLGGGSSDAATTLMGLNQLWGAGLSDARLQGLGLKLGADVPVFIGGQAAWAEGVGEQLTPLELPEPWYVVIVPNCHVATASVFGAPNLTRNSAAIKISDYLGGQEGNDCLPVVLEKYPAVGLAMNELSRHARPRLTGTGACVFASFNGRDEALAAVDSLRDKWTVFAAKGVNSSPVRSYLG